ncbi:MAG: four helix bundle protein [Muribaculaceae bacterium]|nr:four helix bundle protein [Muribaculaceae bacterium]
MSGNNSDFIPLRGNFRKLIVFQKTECIYDITVLFTRKYLRNGDRTIDQMVQAARSGKQNIAEGCAAYTTSRDMEIKLLNVAKASLQELMLFYYLILHSQVESALNRRPRKKLGFSNPKTEFFKQIAIFALAS